MEKLIQEEDTEKMEKIEEFGWYGRAELDTFIRFAGKLATNRKPGVADGTEG